MIGWGIGVVVLILIVFFTVDFAGDENYAPIIEPVYIAPEFANFQIYNYDYVDTNVKNILNRMLGPNGKTAFYLPPTGYINISRGTKYGVAYALNNPNPSGENRFVFNWTAGSEDCGVGLDVAQGWIERGWTSWGKIGEGWIDHMTVYFSFPADVEPCSVTYDFVVLKDGIAYDSKSILFNLV